MLPSVLLILTMCFSGLHAGLETLSQPVITAFLSGHNQLRSPLNIPDLVWNSTLVSVAERRVVDCDFLDNELGGNYYSSSPKGTDSLEIANNALWRWSYEKNSVDPLDPHWTCILQRECHHYSQVVWRNTTSVGCVIFHCSQDWDLTKCEYYPQGNVDGEIPY